MDQRISPQNESLREPEPQSKSSTATTPASHTVKAVASLQPRPRPPCNGGAAAGHGLPGRRHGHQRDRGADQGQAGRRRRHRQDDAHPAAAPQEVQDTLLDHLQLRADRHVPVHELLHPNVAPRQLGEVL